MNESSKKHRIWVIAKYATAREQGFETRTVALAREWVRSGREVVIISSSANHIIGQGRQPPRRTDHIFDGVRMLVLRTFPYRSTASIRRVFSWLHFEWRIFREPLDDLPRPDVIIVTSLSLFSVLNGMRLARKYRCPWVFEVRDIWPLTLTEYKGTSRWHPIVLIMGALERTAYRTASRTVGTMPNLSPHATRIAGTPIECGCVPFGFDPERAPLLSEDDASALDTSTHQLTIGYAGSIGVANALDCLIEVVLALRDDSRFRFVIAGDGALRAEYVRRTANCSNVAWIGKIPHEKVHHMLKGCDILYFAAHPARVWNYGMSLNKLTDYLIAGRPVLASYSGFPSIINEAECGEFLPAADASALLAALERYASLPRHQLRMIGARGRRWLLANRTWHRIAKDYLSLLDAIPTRSLRVPPPRGPIES